MINRQCGYCGGYELDNGVDDLCYCDDEIDPDEEIRCTECGERDPELMFECRQTGELLCEECMKTKYPDAKPMGARQ